MLLPSRRWFAVAAALAVLGPVSLLVPEAGGLLFVTDAAWVLAFLADAWLVARIDLGAFPVTREAPPAFSVGRPLPVTYRWHNPASRSLMLRVREDTPAQLEPAGPRERQVELGPRGWHSETIEYVPKRRGKSSGGRLFLRVLGPLGLCWRQGRRELPWPVVVYPNLRAAVLRSLPTQAQRHREAGFRNLRRLGEGRMFESLKEWVPGEDTRSIDWKATARRGKLMARQYEAERRQHVMIAIDAGRMLTAEIEGRARLEAAIDAALELAHSAAGHDDNVGLLVFADEVLSYVPPGRGRRVLRQILDALAGIEGRLVEPDYPAAFAYLAAHNRKRALTVLFTDLIDRTASEAFLWHAGSLRPRHVPLAVTLRDPGLERLAATRPETGDQAFERAAAEELLMARAAALAELRSRGVLVLDVLPEGAARAVVERYEKLKRRAVV
ncbi:MAG TPA: DUF58 domain-containing protein [Gemmatimonadales bacterium]|nr:DUF58 domain-containing protein [Gemmatimonadales bacterium]